MIDELTRLTADNATLTESLRRMVDAVESDDELQLIEAADRASHLLDECRPGDELLLLLYRAWEVLRYVSSTSLMVAPSMLREPKEADEEEARWRATEVDALQLKKDFEASGQWRLNDEALDKR